MGEGLQEQRTKMPSANRNYHLGNAATWRKIIGMIHTAILQPENQTAVLCFYFF
jgi:hypothetical protein